MNYTSDDEIKVKRRYGPVWSTRIIIKVDIADYKLVRAMIKSLLKALKRAGAIRYYKFDYEEKLI